MGTSPVEGDLITVCSKMVNFDNKNTDNISNLMIAAEAKTLTITGRCKFRGGASRTAAPSFSGTS